VTVEVGALEVVDAEAVVLKALETDSEELVVVMTIVEDSVTLTVVETKVGKMVISARAASKQPTILAPVVTMVTAAGFKQASVAVVLYPAVTSAAAHGGS